MPVATPAAPSDRTPMDADLLRELALQGRDAGQPLALFQAVERAAARAIGFRLFTIMRFDAARLEVERAYSTMPAVYPVGGRKPKAGTWWADQVLRDRRVFRAATAEAMKPHFADYETLAGLGLGSILNVPVAYDGVCLGTMNLTHGEGYYQAADEGAGLMLAAFLAPALLADGHPSTKG